MFVILMFYFMQPSFIEHIPTRVLHTLVRTEDTTVYKTEKTPMFTDISEMKQTINIIKNKLFEIFTDNYSGINIPTYFLFSEEQGVVPHLE